MRILHIIESLEFGGAEKVVISLANSMAGTQQVSICCVKTIGALAAELDRRIDVFCLDKLEGNDFLLPLRLARIFRRNAYDVVHTHNWGVFLEGGLAGILARTPVLVHTVHGPYAKYPDTLVARIKLTLRHFFERIVAFRFRQIATVSDAIADYVVTDIAINREAVVTVHNGIPVSGDTACAGSGGDEVVFMTAGRLVGVKNHELMVRALREVLDAGTRARLLIVGDGPERERIERCVRDHKLQDNVTLLGFRSDVGDLLLGADVFLMTSRYEGISIAMLEAMRAGLPVIATRVGGIPETVRDGTTGLLLGPDDLPGLVEAMLRLARSKPLRQAMGRRGLEFLVEEFSLERMTFRYLKLYSFSTG